MLGVIDGGDTSSGEYALVPQPRVRNPTFGAGEAAELEGSGTLAVRGREGAEEEGAEELASTAMAAVEVIQGTSVVRSRRRPGATRRPWAELGDIQDAIRRSRAGGSAPIHLLRTARPERAMSYWDWSSIIRYEDLITPHDMYALAIRYRSERVFNMPAGDKIVWANNAGIRLYDEAEPLGTEYDSRRRIYGMEVVSALVKEGLFEPGAEDGLEYLANLFAAYDELLQVRDEVHADMLAHKIRTIGEGMLRVAFGVPIARAAGKPLQWAFVRTAYRRSAILRSEQAYSGRRFANMATFAVAAGAGLYLWREAGGAIPFIDDGPSNVAGPSRSLRAPNIDSPVPSDVPIPGSGGGGVDIPDGQPVGDGGSAAVNFLPGAYETSAGEGWINQFDQMGLKYDADFMNNGTGAWLERMGYAYLEYDPSTGAYDWRMNYTDINADVLDELYKRAASAGLNR